VPEQSLVNLSVYNMLGEKVEELVNEVKAQGEYDVNFDAANLPSGIYIAKLSSGDNIRTIKMSLTK